MVRRGQTPILTMMQDDRGQADRTWLQILLTNRVSCAAVGQFLPAGW